MMRKNILKSLALAALSLCTAVSADAQCLSAPNGQWPSSTYNPTCNGTTQSITGAGYNGEYSKINLTAGYTYTFTSSVSTDYITISDNGGTTAFVYGTTPVSFAVTTSGTYRFFTHTDYPGCGSNSISRTRAVSCIVTPVLCSGTPAPGNTMATATSTSPGIPVTLSFQNAQMATGLSFQWYESVNGGGFNPIVNATNNTYTTTPSGFNNTYEYYADVTCAGSTGSSTPVTVTTTANYCVPASVYGCTDGDVIARVQLNTLDNNSGTGCPSGTAGYSDYTSNMTLTTTLMPATTYSCKVWAGQWAANYAVWIDYNDDGVFSSSERVGYTTSAVAGSGAVGVLGSSATFPIVLSCNPPAGTHRLRVREVYNMAGSAIQPCEAANTATSTYLYGEIEDYMITIDAPPACAAGGFLTAANPTYNSVDLSWTLNCAAATLWDFEYGPPGFTLGTGTLVTGAAAIDAYTLTGLDDTTEFEIYYRANCGGITSAWSFPTTFTTMSAPCAGAPDAALATGPATACAGQPFTLDATGLTYSQGVTHQWEEYISGTWTPIAGATASSYTVSSANSTVTDYRLHSYCSNTGDDASSNVVTVGVGAFYECYCIGTNDGTSQITNVTITGTTMNNNSGSAPGPDYYNSFPATGSSTAELTQGMAYTISTTYDAGAISSVWIDYNQDGVYDATEWVQLGTTGTAHTATITVPGSAMLGMTGMRVRSRAEGNINGSGDACLAMGSGETENYVITIVAAIPCSSAPAPGAINTPTVSSCPGVDITMTLNGATMGPDITYQWESSPAGGTAWAPIVGETNTTYTIVGGVSSVTDYRVTVTCTTTGAADMTVPVTISPAGPTQCYCVPSVINGCTDGDVIARVMLNTLDNNSGTGCPSGALGYSDYSSDPTLTTTLMPATTYSCQVWAGEWTANYAVWIDYNDDGVFDMSERVGYTSSPVAGSGLGGVLGSSATFPIVLSCTPPTGMHRMRVREVYNMAGIDIDPCASSDPNTGEYYYGETEDYTITIDAPPACPSGGLMTAANETATTVDLSWDLGCATATEWDFEYGPHGFTQGTGTMVPNITAATSYTLGGLNMNTQYDVYYRANCGSGSVSAWSFPVTFTTLPAPCATPSVSVSASATSICNGASVTFTASPVDAGAAPTYEWMVNGSSVSGVTGDVYTSSTLANGDVVSVTVTADCFSAPTATSNTVAITVNAATTPSVAVNASASMVCNGGTATLTAVPTDGGSSPSYQWYMNGGAITGATSFNYTAAGINDGDEFYVEMTSSDACATNSMATSNTESIGVYPSSATITTTGSTTICSVGGSVVLTAGAGSSYLWSNGLQTQSITATAAGNYSVTVTSANGCIDQSQVVGVTSKVMPTTAKIKTVGATTVCAPNKVAIVLDMPLGSTTGFAYQWNMGGSPIAGATDSVYSADATGSYTVTISGGSSCSKTSAAKAATIKPMPVADFTVGGPTSFCAGGNVAFTAASAGTGATYTWLKNGNTNAGSGATKAFNASGEYALVVTLAGCKDTSDYSEAVTVYAAAPLPKIKNIGSTTVCEGTMVSLQLDPSVSSMGSSFQWNLDGTAVTGATDSTYDAGVSGNYTLTLTTVNGCSKTSSLKKAVIKPMPVAEFTAGGPTEFCAGGSVTFTAPTLTGYTYTWLRDGNVNAGTGASKVQKLAGVYTVVATLAGCKDTSDVSETITVNALPVAVVSTMDPTTFCAGSYATIVATPSGAGYTYAWYKTNVLDAGNTSDNYMATLAGTYKAMVTDDKGCVSKISTSSVVIKVNPIPTATIAAQGSTTIAANGSVKLKATPTSGVTWQWYLDGVAISGATAKDYIATAGGDYTVEVTKLGCSGTSAVTTVTQSSVKEEEGTTSNPMGTEEASAIFELSAFPNPVSGILNVNVRGIEEVDATLQVMDMNGKLVAEKNMREASATVDMTGYANGMYLIRYKDNQGRTGTIKITKQ